jgi:hypothetical protein
MWLDRGELAALIEFAATGALDEAERRIQERADARKRLDAWGAALRATGPRHYWTTAMHGGSAPIDDLAEIARLVPRLDPEDE